MDGTLSLESALEQRLQVINCQPGDIQAFLKAYPPETRLFPVRGSMGRWVEWHQRADGMPAGSDRLLPCSCAWGPLAEAGEARGAWRCIAS